MRRKAAVPLRDRDEAPNELARGDDAGPGLRALAEFAQDDELASNDRPRSARRFARRWVSSRDEPRRDWTRPAFPLRRAPGRILLDDAVFAVEPRADRLALPRPKGREAEALAKDFAKNKFDMKLLVKTIMKSRTYQLSVKTNEWNEDDQANFSHALPRRLPRGASPRRRPGWATHAA